LHSWNHQKISSFIIIMNTAGKNNDTTATAAAGAPADTSTTTSTAAAATASGKPKSTAAKPGTNNKKQQVSADQRYYCVDETRLETLKKEKPWMSSPKYFTNVALSPSAVTKMMMHCASGVEKGTAKGGNPIEGQ
jgi:hypothetical protein